MTVALIGGIDRLSEAYKTTANADGVKLRFFTRTVPRMKERLSGVDCIILITGGISHQAAREANAVAKSCGVPLIRSQTGSISALRRCLDCIPKEDCGAQRSRSN